MNKWLIEIPLNEKGKDYIVGDLHGNYYLLLEALKKINFDPDKDRLFSVGDLVDRGPNVYECLKLLDEPWFFAVKGNHENMFQTKLTLLGLTHPIEFIRSLLYGDRKNKIKHNIPILEIAKYLLKIRTLPLVLKIKNNDMDFWVMHAQRPTNKSKVWLDSDFIKKIKIKYYDKDIEQVLWKRKVIYSYFKEKNISHKKNIFDKEEDIEIITALKDKNFLLPEVGLTYCGHTILNKVVAHKSHVFIDGGYYKGGVLRIADHSEIIKNIKENN